MTSSLAITYCSGCEKTFRYKQLQYCGKCDGWYCQDCYTEEADHECLTSINEEDEEEDSGKASDNANDHINVSADEGDHRGENGSENGQESVSVH